MRCSVMKKILVLFILLFVCLCSAVSKEIKKNKYYVPDNINPKIRKMYDNLKDYPYLIVQTVNNSNPDSENSVMYNENLRFEYTKQISFFDWKKGVIYEFYIGDEGRYEMNIVSFNKAELVTKTKSMLCYNIYEYSNDYSSWKLYNLCMSTYDDAFCKNLIYTYDALSKESLFNTYYASSDEVWPFDFINDSNWNYVIETQKTVEKDNGYFSTVYNPEDEKEIISEYEKIILDKNNFTEKSEVYKPYHSVSEGKIQNDNNENVTQAVLEFDDDEYSETDTFRYQYSYDSKKNWVTKKSAVNGNENYPVYERQIYYDEKTAPITFEAFVKENGWLYFYFEELPDNFSQADFYSLSGDYVASDLALEYYYKAYELGNKEAYNKILTLLTIIDLNEIMDDIKKNWAKESLDKFLPQLLKDYETVSKQKK